jgi:hypothetical protein
VALPAALPARPPVALSGASESLIESSPRLG